MNDLKANLFNDHAMGTLMSKLKRINAFGKDRVDFFFWNTDPRNWPDVSYQARAVNWVSNFVWPPYKVLTDLNPQYQALGDFTINAIPEGYVQPKGNGKYDICVNKVYLFINDSFNFEGFAYLGPWDFETGMDKERPGGHPFTAFLR